MSEFTLLISEKPKAIPVRVNVTRLAHITGYSKSHVSRIFSGKTVPSVTCLSQLANALGVGLDELHQAIGRGERNVTKTC